MDSTTEMAVGQVVKLFGNRQNALRRFHAYAAAAAERTGYAGIGNAGLPRNVLNGNAHR